MTNALIPFSSQRKRSHETARTSSAMRRLRRKLLSSNKIPNHILSLMIAVGGICLATCSIAQPLTGKDARRPNIVFILTDDQRWDALGCMGNRIIRTPNIDHLADEGVLFKNAFVTTSVCGISRASILTGTYARARGVGDLSRMVTPSDPAATYPAILRNHGYETGHIGKWDVGPGEAGFQLGISLFDYWAGDRFHGNYWHEQNCPLVTNDGRRSKTKICCTCPPEGSLPRIGHAGIERPMHFDQDIIPLKMKQFMSGRNKEKPFFLSISFRGPKDPWSNYPESAAKLYESDMVPVPETATCEDAARQPPFLQKSMGSDHGKRMVCHPRTLREEIRKHYRLISTIDDTVGELCRLLAEEGVNDNTVIIFTSDNGCFFGEHGFWGKWLPYEASIRVPLIIFDPRLAAEKRGAKLDEMVLNIDLAPTFLTLAGCAIPRSMQGRELTPLLQRKQDIWRTDWFYEHTWTAEELTPTAEGRIAPSEAVRSNEWKLVRYISETPFVEQLFHLKTDPAEANNRIADESCASVAQAMREKLEAYKRDLATAN